MVHTTPQEGGRSSGELREEGDAEMRREGGMSAGRRHEVSDDTKPSSARLHMGFTPDGECG